VTDVADVVVVGGGIGGASLAYALAHAGLGVVVLESTTVFKDRVRGEALQPWGVKEARALDVEQVLLDAGAHVCRLAKQYSEGVGEAGQIPVSVMVPGIPGTLNLRHPVACQALVDAASAAGAKVVRGTRDIKLSGGSSPRVAYTADGSTREVRTSLIVGAEGRVSTVRKQTGISLERQEPVSYSAGLLLEGLSEVPDDHDVLAGEGDVFLAIFHQGGGRARVYLFIGRSGRHRFSGAKSIRPFLDACALSCYPWSTQLAQARPAGPLATYPGDDTWTPTPYADGVVLIGDAAGHNNPVIGQGLAIALRDARTVRDFILDGARTPHGFASYGAERFTRMERLRYIADVIAVTQVEDADNRPARRAFMLEKMTDPDVVGVLAGAFAGPEMMPPDAVDLTLLDRIRNAS
jgi:2-polyprenyl-6-methoxyphenol hydroxylase-like FAD-dependent oxidoreductase